MKKTCTKRKTVIIQVNPDQEIKIESGDANDFIISLNKIVGKLINKKEINEVCLIRIKNWFDHKWLHYSAKSVVAYRGGKNISIFAAIISSSGRPSAISKRTNNQLFYSTFG